MGAAFSLFQVTGTKYSVPSMGRKEVYFGSVSVCSGLAPSQKGMGVGLAEHSCSWYGGQEAESTKGGAGSEMHPLLIKPLPNSKSSTNPAANHFPKSTEHLRL